MCTAMPAQSRKALALCQCWLAVALPLGRQTFVPFTGYGVCQSASLLCTKYTWEAFGPLHYVLRRQTRIHLLCSGLSSSKNRQVRKSYTTNTMSFFLRIQKEQNPTVEPTWVRKHHLFLSLFFFAFFPPAFFFILKVVWICTRYGVEKKCRTEKKMQMKVRVETQCK